MWQMPLKLFRGFKMARAITEGKVDLSLILSVTTEDGNTKHIYAFGVPNKEGKREVNRCLSIDDKEVADTLFPFSHCIIERCEPGQYMRFGTVWVRGSKKESYQTKPERVKEIYMRS